MGETLKKVLIFVIVMALIIGFVNALFGFVMPVKPVRLISNNMEPTYDKGDVLFYQKADSYEKGDVVVYMTKRGQGVVRIIDKNEDGSFKGKGDKNPAPIKNVAINEKHIRKNQIIGKVLFETESYVFYPLVYGIQIVIVLFLTKSIYHYVKN